MNSRSPNGQKDDNNEPSLNNAGYLLSRILFLSFIWSFLSRIMQGLGIWPNNILTTGSSTRGMTTRLTGSKLSSIKALSELKNDTRTSEENIHNANKYIEQTAQAKPDEKPAQDGMEKSVVTPKF